MKDLTNILKPGDELNDEQLKKYISGKMSPEELHAVETQIANSDFVNDAVEGLQVISAKPKLDDYVNQLNKNLHLYLTSKKEIKERRKMKDISWIIVAIIVILLLCILGYIVIRIQHQKQIERHSILVQYLFKNNVDKISSYIL